jgi:hypothetical protein
MCILFFYLATFVVCVIIVFFYSIYGLCIGSTLELPELKAVPPCPADQLDVTVLLDPAPVTRPSWENSLQSEESQENAELYLATQSTGQCTSLAWDEAGHFVVRDGREITIHPREGVEDRVLRLFLLGPTFGALLHQRGVLVLHASVVILGGEAVAFLGGSGWGKSTMAAAFHNSGHTVVTDDQAAIEMKYDEIGGDQVLVLPSLPQLKLWPESAALFEDDLSTLPQLHPGHDKRARRLRERFASTPVPLSHIFVLHYGDDLANDPLNRREALLELMAHSYCAAIIEPEDAPAHLQQCAQIAARVSVSRLTRPRSLQQLPQLVQFVQEQRRFAQVLNDGESVFSARGARADGIRSGEVLLDMAQ